MPYQFLLSLLANVSEICSVSETTVDSSDLRRTDNDNTKQSTVADICLSIDVPVFLAKSTVIYQPLHKKMTKHDVFFDRY